MTIDAGVAPPAQFTFLCDLYRRMSEDSKEVTTEDGPVRVYKGYLTKLMLDDMGLPVPYYSNLTQALRKMGCAIQLKRGGGSSASEWRLLKEPTLSGYNKFMDSQAAHSQSKTAQVASQVQDLHARVSALEEAFGEMLEAMKHAS